VINVKDFGATGNGVTDDQPAIQAAINYAYTRFVTPLHVGGLVFVPPGTYIIGNPPLELARLTGNLQGNLKFVGASRASTILKGNSTNFIVQKADQNADSLQDVGHMTIWNTNQTPGSGALHIHQNGRQPSFDNLKLIGFTGLQLNHDVYNMMLTNIIAECSVPIGAANSASPGPAAGSVGLYIGQGQMSNCSATGFDIGVSMFGTGVGCNNGRFYNCNVGIDHAGHVPSGQNQLVQVSNVLANRFENCKWGLKYEGGEGSIVAGNVFIGTQGPAIPVTIQAINGNGSTVTVTTAAHNLPVGTSRLVLVTNPASWTPDGSGNQIITVTRTSSTQFTYAWTHTGSFISGTWNYPIEYGITVHGGAHSGMLGNNFEALLVAKAHFDTGRDPTFNIRVMAASMRGTFTMANADLGGNAGWWFVNCVPNPSAGVNPNAFMRYSALTTVNNGPLEGMEFNIVDAQSAPFAGTVSGGGSNHYKVRYDGTNWIRIG